MILLDSHEKTLTISKSRRLWLIRRKAQSPTCRRPQEILFGWTIWNWSAKKSWVGCGFMRQRGKKRHDECLVVGFIHQLGQTLAAGHEPQAARASPSVFPVVLRPSSVRIKIATVRTTARHVPTPQHAAPRGLPPMAGALTIYF